MSRLHFFRPERLCLLDRPCAQPWVDDSRRTITARWRTGRPGEKWIIIKYCHYYYDRGARRQRRRSSRVAAGCAHTWANNQNDVKSCAARRPATSRLRGTTRRNNNNHDSTDKQNGWRIRFKKNNNIESARWLGVSTLADGNDNELSSVRRRGVDTVCAEDSRRADRTAIHRLVVLVTCAKTACTDERVRTARRVRTTRQWIFVRQCFWLKTFLTFLTDPDCCVVLSLSYTLILGHRYLPLIIVKF